MKNIPFGLVIFRFLLGPLLIIASVFAANKEIYIIILLLALLSDVFDGIIARKLGVATSLLRKLDSWADTSFYVCVFAVSLSLYFTEILDEIYLIMALIMLEIIRHIYDQVKFGQSAAYHMWSAKLWGIFLFLGFVQLLGFGEVGPLLKIAIILGIFTDVEGLLASFILPSWQADIPSCYHAYQIRKSASS